MEMIRLCGVLYFRCDYRITDDNEMEIFRIHVGMLLFIVAALMILIFTLKYFKLGHALISSKLLFLSGIEKS